VSERGGTISRRRLLLGGASVAGAGAVGAFAIARSTSADSTDGAAAGAPGAPVEFFGEHQAGIVTPAPDRLYFAAFDVITDDVAELVGMLQRWTAAAAQMTRGEEAGEFGAVDGPLLAPPEDTGEALGLPAAALTLTFGFGPNLFTDADGNDRFGLADRRPANLIDIPHFPGDLLDPARSGGDLCVQACSNDPQVAFHAVRNLARLGFGVVSLRWSQLGFGRTSSTSQAQVTARNLFGFKDGTANLKAEETDALQEHVWAQADDGSEWMAGGSYLIARRINMHIETWDRTSLQDQEGIIGRTKGTGAPLSGGDEFAEPDFAMEGARELPIIPVDSHVRLAHPSMHGGARMLRRGYNFTDGSDGLGRIDAGLFFIAFVRNPATQFVPVQQLLSRQDALTEYLQHRSSAIFAVPPGVPAAGEMIGAALFRGRVDGV
jgi:deferrochelatase/peroxidase EfeB